MTTLFDNQPVPTWAADCGYCVPNKYGQYPTETGHNRWHTPVTCGICGYTSPHRSYAELNHSVELGASRRLGALVCLSVALRLAHLSHDKHEGRKSRPSDLTVLELGWKISDTGREIPPEGWLTVDQWDGNQIQGAAA